MLVLCDLDGRVLEARKHAGEWSPEDEMRLSRLGPFRESGRASYRAESGRIHTNRMDVGGCTYIAGFGGDVCIAAVARRRGSRRLEKRIRHALLLLDRVARYRRALDPRIVGPVTRDNILSWILEA